MIKNIFIFYSLFHFWTNVAIASTLGRPILSWGTYFGGEAWERGTCVAIDMYNNIYLAGLTYSTSNIATSNAFQTRNLSNDTLYDCTGYFTKFTSNGSLLWASYFGGTGETVINGIATDKLGNVYITGQTTSPDGISTEKAYQSKYGGGTVTGGDAFLAKFDNNGTLLWSTYFGGKNGDGGYGICIDLNNNIFITGFTQSYTNIANNAIYQSKYGGGDEDAFIAKFNNSGSLIWSTYFGGTGVDFGKGIVANKNGDIYIVGKTSSPSNISTKGAFKTSMSNSDSSDAFICKFDSSGNIVWSSYFGGDMKDWAGGITIDTAGCIYMCGATYSFSGIATSGAFQTIINGDLNDYVAKFNSNGLLMWGTYFGGGGFGGDFQSITCDNYDYIYLLGCINNNSLLVTKDGWQTKYSGNIDAYIAKFNSNDSLKWASYYGGALQDLGCAIVVDTDQNIYVTGTTYSMFGISTIGSFKSKLGLESNGDAFLSKFAFKLLNNDAGIASIQKPYDTICINRQPVIVLLKNFGTNVLHSVTINYELNNILQKPQNWIGNLQSDSTIPIILDTGILRNGIDNLKAWTSKPNGKIDSVNGNDTAYSEFNIIPPDSHWSVTSIGSLAKTFFANQKNYSDNSYSWKFGDSSRGIGATSTHVFSQDGEYSVDLSVCNSSYDSQIWVIKDIDISVFPNPFFGRSLIQFKLPYSTSIKIVIFDAYGKNVNTILDKEFTIGFYTLELNSELLGFRNGIYFLYFIYDNGIKMKKIINIGP